MTNYYLLKKLFTCLLQGGNEGSLRRRGRLERNDTAPGDFAEAGSGGGSGRRRGLDLKYTRRNAAATDNLVEVSEDDPGMLSCFVLTGACANCIHFLEKKYLFLLILLQS